MTPEGFLRRLQAGKVNDCTYRRGDPSASSRPGPTEGDSSSPGRNAATATSTTRVPTPAMIATNSCRRRKCWRSSSGADILHRCLAHEG